MSQAPQTSAHASLAHPPRSRAYFSLRPIFDPPLFHPPASPRVARGCQPPAARARVSSLWALGPCGPSPLPSSVPPHVRCERARRHVPRRPSSICVWSNSAFPGGRAQRSKAHRRAQNCSWRHTSTKLRFRLANPSLRLPLSLGVLGAVYQVYPLLGSIFVKIDLNHTCQIYFFTISAERMGPKFNWFYLGPILSSRRSSSSLGGNGLLAATNRHTNDRPVTVGQGIGRSRERYRTSPGDRVHPTFDRHP